MRKHIIALLVVVMVLCCCLTLAACNKTNVLDSYIFEMDGTTVSEDFTLPATIGGENASWKSDNTAIQTEKRDSDWLYFDRYRRQEQQKLHRKSQVA